MKPQRVIGPPVEIRFIYGNYLSKETGSFFTRRREWVTPSFQKFFFRKAYQHDTHDNKI